MTDQTVADVLHPHSDDKAVKNLRSFVLGGVEADQLGYEDWVRPMKLTGGRVCLRWRDKPAERHGCVYWKPDGLRYTFGTERTETGPDAVHCLRFDLQSPGVTVTPVLREDTPFGGEDSAER